MHPWEVHGSQATEQTEWTLSIGWCPVIRDCFFPLFGLRDVSPILADWQRPAAGSIRQKHSVLIKHKPSQTTPELVDLHEMLRESTSKTLIYFLSAPLFSVLWLVFRSIIANDSPA